ncbi:hypothetical protein BGW38_010433 [Lunasporangiospora selenospora]|uniref:Uncharacterized protein n=1 Tax=Lunasporangiospora selenospora TaxID=979761 RepID=A0A9P6FXN9_9FUNG|nr:hypothetical protein BGW38_010433 [Lunasporangiospora selenospora]
MAERSRRALLASEEAIKFHIHHYLSATKQGEWEITNLLKDLFKKFYLSEDSMKDHSMFCEWFSNVFRQYADENDKAKGLLSVLGELLMANPVRSCFLVESGKTLLKTHLLADVVEDLRGDHKRAKTDETASASSTAASQSSLPQSQSISYMLNELHKDNPMYVTLDRTKRRVVDISNVFSHHSRKTTTKQLSRLLGLKLQLVATAEEMEVIHKISKSKTIEKVEDIIPTLYKRGATPMEKYIRSALACLCNIWETQQACEDCNNETWWQSTLYSQVFDLCFQINGWSTKRSEVLSTTLKSARSVGIDVPNHRVDFVITPKDDTIDALTSEDKAEASVKVEKDLAKGRLIREATLWLWRDLIGAKNKDLIAELEALGCQWVGNELVVTGTRLLGETFLHYNKAKIKFPLQAKGASTALGLLVVMSLERALTLNFEKMAIMLEDRADNQELHLELASDGDHPVYYFQADMKGCLADVKSMRYAPGILTSEENFMQLYRLRNVELGRKTKGKSAA